MGTRVHLLQCGLLIVIGALGLSGSGGRGPRLDAGLHPGDTGLGWMSDRDVCPLSPPDTKFGFLYIGPGKFAGGMPQDYCDDASAKSQAAEISLHYFSQDLARRGDARWLFLEPLFGPDSYRESEWAKWKAARGQIASEKNRWVDEAIRSAPKDALIAWAAAEACGGLESCDEIAMARHVIELEPDNGAAHLLLAEVYFDHHDEAAIRGEFAEAAASKRYWMPEQALMARRLATLRGWNPPRPRASSSPEAAACLADWPDCAELHRYELAMSADDLQTWPFFHIDYICEPHHVPTVDESLRADCKRVYQAMAGNDFSQLGQQDALHHLISLTSGQAESEQWRERLRVYTWITSHYPSPSRSDEKTRLAATQAFFDIWVQHGLIDALRARLVTAGIAAMPPPNWHQKDSIAAPPPVSSK